MASRGGAEGEPSTSMGTEEGRPALAQPLHLQRLERAVKLDNFIGFIHNYFSNPVNEGEDTEAESLSDIDEDGETLNGGGQSEHEKRAEKMRLYNFDNVKKSRRWLKNVLLSDTSSSEEDNSPTEDDLQDWLRFHKLRQMARAELNGDPELRQYQYYGVGMLSQHDPYPDQQKALQGSKKKSRERKAAERRKAKLKRVKLEPGYDDDPFNQEGSEAEGGGGSLEDARHTPESVYGDAPSGSRPHGRRKSAAAHEASMNLRRRRLWVGLSKKEVSRAQKQKVNAHKEMLTNAKRFAVACQREVRRNALASQKASRDTPGRARRLTREMLLYWKRYEKVEKEHRRRAEREAQEQLRIDIEMREAKRQQRKLNFLITQTELYAHFMSRKMAGLGPDPRQEEILGSLDESASCSRSSSLLEAEADDDYDKELMKSQALRNAEDAYLAHRAKTDAFDTELRPSQKSPKKGGAPQGDLNEDFRITADPSLATEDLSQPLMFVGKLKTYQLKGMNWLYSLYDKGINGILADEMGLGKTVQTIAFLAALAEVQSIWGPFLVIAPASTLHNWQQEFTKFVPKFRVVPYWGNTSDRKVLRQFWGRLEGGQGSSFHVVVTSYQLVVQDVKYFQRIRWQYMVLDEAQAIKSTSSVRWKILLAFHCRNRLLLTGTPIQNTMAELWALLHFIMPTLFDSHDEFNEWFSKDIESHAENKSTIDEKHLSRLHMILKPFMLRRIKKDVENELSDKIEVQVTCWLAQRQKLLYQGLKNKISIEDLMQSAGAASSQAQSATSSLMNLVMQFRKVCNHPDLFERREVRSPFHMRAGPFQLPRLLFAQGILQSWNRRQSRWPSIFHPSHVHHSLFKSLDGRPTGGFSFSRFVGLSSSELAKVMLCGLLERFLAILAELKEAQRTHHTHVWRENQDSGRHLSHRSLLVTSHAPTGAASLSQSATLRGLVFGAEPRCYALETQRLHATRETAAHRELRQRKVKTRHHHHHHHHHHGGGGGGTSAAPGAPAGAVTSHHGATAPTTPSAKKAHHHQPQPPQQQQQQPPPQHQHGPASPPALPEFPHRPLPVQVLECVPTEVPRFLVSCTSPRVTAEPPELWCHSSSALWWWRGVQACGSPQAHRWWRTGQLPGTPAAQGAVFGPPPTPEGGLASARPLRGWSHICIPDKETLVTDSGKLQVLDSLLCRLKSEGHRVLIYSQMTRMIDLLEEYMWHRKHTYMRLDGSSKISDRRDMVADFQTRSDIFVFLLSTRAGGLGINLTAADTVVFYDSDWNPTVDQQAMDRAHRLGQTKQVTVYRLVCKGTIEERILQRAREKSEIQRMVISGGNFKPDTLKPKEVVSLLLDDAELERKFRQRQEERKQLEDGPEKQPKERKRRSDKGEKRGPRKKRAPVEHNTTIPSVSSAPPPSLALHQDTESVVSLDSVPPSPYSEQSLSSVAVAQDESSSEGPLIVDDGSPSATPVPTPATPEGGGTVSPGGSGKGRSGRGTGRARGRPRGSTRRAPAALRGSMLAAAERAGAQAGAQAGFAAYGYSVPWNGPPSGTAGGGPSAAGGSAAAPAVRGGGNANSFRGALQQQGTNRSPRQGNVTSGSSNAAT
ncbi:chromatin-remodeling ATPase INO80 isoform X1 [Ixodes scapularis]|uniref:chromatin-remodeling ATPase INO80 isoform X1 n=1 Tax=Ixodes scapularis TaxID=6945 RepID=UPI001A9CCB4B|nr:chromatin-remodeling ATPase INO80 isoform X1 [Ixodes scapularis]